MSLIVESKGSSFKPVPAGMHLGRCYRIVDIGTQKTEFKGQVKMLHKVMLGWELFGEDELGDKLVMDDGKPLSLHKSYTMSWADKATLRIHLQAWRGKPFTPEEMRRFDLKNILGAYCMLNVIQEPGQDGSLYSKITSISPVPRQIKELGLPAAVNKPQLFNIAEPDMELFASLSENTKMKIQQSPEWQKTHGPAPKTPERKHEAPTMPDLDDDIPF